ncbi:MAG: hypothetical protein RJA22_483 [Verrucomicrobiota bacterium]
MTSRSLFLALSLVGALCARPAAAQLPGGSQAGMNATLLQLFGEVDSFSAKAQVIYEDRDTRQQVTMPMGFSLWQGKLRLEFDLSQIRSAQVPTQMLANLKMAGLDRAVTIVRPDQGKVVMIYPGVSSYVEMPMAREEAADWRRKYTIQRAKLGAEKLEGVACEKQRVTVTSDAGAAQEATVWYASSPRTHPVKLQMNQPGATVTMQFRDVSLARPAATLFEAAQGLTKYPSVEVLTQSAMIKALGGGKAPR